MPRCFLCEGPNGWPVTFRGKKFALCIECVRTDELHKPENREKLAAMVGPGVEEKQPPPKKTRKKSGPKKANAKTASNR
jgi:hypothetical protein